MINIKLFEQFKNTNSKILVVTKYWDKETTDNLINEINKNFPKIVFGFGENRIENAITKNIPKQNLHFIGNIQTKKIEKIVNYCSTIHSLYKIEHARKIDEVSKKLNTKTKVFLQINLDPTKDAGINKDDFESILKDFQNLENIETIGISGMGAQNFNYDEKQKEFETLLNLRDKFLPGKLISAGTSVDYEIALKNKIDVVRIGSKIISD